MSQIPGYLTLSEVASRLRLSHSMVSRYVRRGILPSKNLGNVYLVPKESLKNFVRQPRGNPQFRRKTG